MKNCMLHMGIVLGMIDSFPQGSSPKKVVGKGCAQQMHQGVRHHNIIR
jgi:hypothetical protein